MTKVKGVVVELHAYFRNGMPEWAVDVQLADGNIVTAYHHPRESNKPVSESWAQATSFMGRPLDQKINGPEVSLKVGMSPKGEVSYEVITLKSDESARSGIL